MSNTELLLLGVVSYFLYSKSQPAQSASGFGIGAPCDQWTVPGAGPNAGLPVCLDNGQVVNSQCSPGNVWMITNGAPTCVPSS